ncbi:hypothetical protein OIU84_010798 [Salix udensis]|uniref:Uncharacterized protein n=1 Tax=Salix udensis TaxID=889485 RepID=A0AAD6JLW7_9ROSI|nr:hypothetical protein OIU84_010798 [Salix udensis]
MLSRNRMLIRSLLSSSFPCTRSFSGTASPPRKFLKTGDTLRQTRIFTNEDVTEYSKLYFLGLLHPTFLEPYMFLKAYIIKRPVYVGDAVAGEVQVTNIRENKSRYIVKFSTKCFKNDKLLVIDGEAVAILPTLAAEKVNVVD